MSSSSCTVAIAFPTGAIYQERDHNPCLIEYPCVVLQSKPGEEWNEGQTLFQILICCDLNPVSSELASVQARLMPVLLFVAVGEVGEAGTASAESHVMKLA